jgi:imidazoleglycerol-phosphate dehydratase
MDVREPALGFQIKKLTPNEVKAIRKTTETTVTCVIQEGARRTWKLNTGLHFLNHMIEELAYFSGFNIDTTVESPHFLLAHTVIEDTGITLGRLFYELAMARSKKTGIRGHGAGEGVLDEAYVNARVSFEGRAGTYISRQTRRFGKVEDVQEEFLESFFQGFSQGMRLTIHLDLLRGDDPHHLWEACFRGFGSAIQKALESDEWHKGGIAGVKGTVD